MGGDLLINYRVYGGRPAYYRVYGGRSAYYRVYGVLGRPVRYSVHEGTPVHRKFSG